MLAAMPEPEGEMERPSLVSDLDWDADRARAFADRTVDLWEELLRRLPELPVAGRWNAGQVRAAMAREVPDEPLPDDELFDYLRAMTFEYSMYPGHPRFMAYISGTGTVPGAPADLLAAGLNMNVGGWRLAPSATEIELALMRWFCREFGLDPQSAGGYLVSGGAMAVFVALKVARDVKANWDVRGSGIRSGPALRFYASQEVHVVSQRAAAGGSSGSNAQAFSASLISCLVADWRLSGLPASATATIVSFGVSSSTFTNSSLSAAEWPLSQSRIITTRLPVENKSPAVSAERT